MPRLALASNPGSKAFTPSDRAFSMSIVPQTRSSVAPRGRSTIVTFFLAMVKGMASSTLCRTSSLIKSGSLGSELKGSLATTSISGKRSAKALIVVDFPVPRSPIIITPPILGSMTLSIRDNFISSWPTIAVKGKTTRRVFGGAWGVTVISGFKSQ